MRDQTDDGTRGAGGVPPAVLANREQFLAFLERRLGQREAAEEILQAAYLKAIEASGSIVQEENTIAWFYRLLRNALIDRRRRQLIEARVLDRHAQEILLDAEQEDEPLKAAICGCIDDLIPTLKPEYAELVRRVDLRGASLQEAAGEAGITTNNASVRLHRARAALRKQLVRTCGACAEHACLDCTCKVSRARTTRGAER